MSDTTVLYVDPFGGLAGDMLMAALLDLGDHTGRLTFDQLILELSGLDLDGWQLARKPVRRGAFAATHVDVRGATEEGHPHRHLSDVRRILEGADLLPGALERALRVFRRLAEAEGAVHGISPDEVHFHEVGAVDSIVDIAGVCTCLELLGVERLVCGPLPLSHGTVRGSHGEMPLPAPATTRLLVGWPVREGHPGHEQVTPTGAAIVSALGEPGSIPEMRLVGSGTGAGTRDPEAYANITRVLLGCAETSSPGRVDVIRAQMDDLSGEHLPPLLDALFDAGALDAFAVPVHMKKGRSGLLVEALCEPDATPSVERALLVHGSTFGVRRHATTRTVLDRWFDTAQTPWGPVRIKVGALEGEILHGSPEFADVQAVARAAGVPAHRVHSEAVAAWRAAATEPAPRSRDEK